MEIGGSRPIDRLLDPSLRSPPRHFHPLACLLPDRPDCDLGVLAQLLDVPGDLGTLIGGTLMLTADVAHSQALGDQVVQGIGSRTPVRA